MESEFYCPKDIPARDIDNFLHDPEERIWKGPFAFIQAADCQFGMIGSYKLHHDKPSWEKEEKLVRRAIRRFNKMRPLPKFFVICGDMLDAFPFNEPPHYYKSAEKMDKELRLVQYDSFVKVFKELNPKIKLICTCGNHDAGNEPTKESMQLYNKQFGADHFCFWVGGIKFVVLNSQLMYVPEALPAEYEAQNKFIDTIKDPTAKFLVVLQHIPFFTVDINEEDTYRNIRKDVRIPILDKLNDAGVRYIFCGHTHVNFGGKYKNVEIVVTSALGAPMGENPSGYRIVHVEETGLTHEYVKLQETTEFSDDEEEKKKCCCNKCNIIYILRRLNMELFSGHTHNSLEIIRKFSVSTATTVVSILIIITVTHETFSQQTLPRYKPFSVNLPCMTDFITMKTKYMSRQC